MDATYIFVSPLYLTKTWNKVDITVLGKNNFNFKSKKKEAWFKVITLNKFGKKYFEEKKTRVDTETGRESLKETEIGRNWKKEIV